MKKSLTLLFLAAFLIRLIALDQSFWLDETTTARVVKNLSFSQIFTQFSPHDFHPPLYYWFMKSWSNLFGYSEISLRLPSVIFSLLTGWVVYKIVKLLNSQATAMWAAAFFLFNPLIVYYSQEARMYMMATFLLTTALYFFLKILNIKYQRSNAHIKNQILFGLFISLSFLTFYGSIFLIIPMLFWLLYKKQYYTFLITFSLFLASFLLISPLLYRQFLNSQIVVSTVLNWKQVLGPASLKNLVLIPIKFTTGRIDFQPLFGLWTAFIFYFVIKNSLLLFLFFSPIFLGVIFSFFTPLLQYFRFIYLLPIMTILLASSTNTTIIRIIVAGGFIIFSSAYLLNPQYHREDWKSLVKNLPTNKVYAVASSKDPVLFYNSKILVEDISKPKNEKELIIIPYAVEIYGVDYRSDLTKRNFKLLDTKSFRGVSFEKWSKQ